MLLQAANRFCSWWRSASEVLLAGFLISAISACSTQPYRQAEPPALLHAGPPVNVPDVDVLAMTPKMAAFVDRYTGSYADMEVRSQMLTLALASSGVLGFDYNENQTLTATQAFNARSGNCIAFANLLVTMARHAGLNARYHEVLIPPEWSSQDDTYIVSKHINVVIQTHHGWFEIDISGRKLKDDMTRRFLQDHEAAAMYYNNLGAEALLSSDLPTAHAYLVKAIRTAPEIADAWSNLGVVLARNDQLADAEMAYRTALGLDSGEQTALANLYDLLTRKEDYSAAEKLQARVERYRQENPYYLLRLSEEAMGQRRFEESIGLLSKAITKKQDDPELHFALARSQYLSGNRAAAELSLDRARALAPDG